MTVRSDSDYTSVEADGDLVLDGELDPGCAGALTQGTVLTIMKRRLDQGQTSTSCPKIASWQTGGHLFRVSYRDNRVTLTVMHAVPPTAPPGRNR